MKVTGVAAVCIRERWTTTHAADVSGHRNVEERMLRYGDVT